MLSVLPELWRFPMAAERGEVSSGLRFLMVLPGAKLMRALAQVTVGAALAFARRMGKDEILLALKMTSNLRSRGVAICITRNSPHLACSEFAFTTW